ncbi:MAG: hypothetical protein AB1422_03335 [bacterium]
MRNIVVELNSRDLSINQLGCIVVKKLFILLYLRIVSIKGIMLPDCEIMGKKWREDSKIFRRKLRLNLNSELLRDLRKIRGEKV